MSTPCRLVDRVGHLYEQGASWGQCGDRGAHHSRQIVAETSIAGAWDPRIDWSWRPTPCTVCGAHYDRSEIRRFAGRPWKWSTEDGHLHPGDMYWQPHYYDSQDCWPSGWTNCPGVHLNVMLPNRHSWDIDSRASNCTLPTETTHRCWIREGTPPKVTAGKAGHTCSAGAGSIRSGDYHGFLRDGVLT